MPFATAGEPIAYKRRPLVSGSPDTTGRRTSRNGGNDILAITLLKTAAVVVAISVYYLTGLH